MSFFLDTPGGDKDSFYKSGHVSIRENVGFGVLTKKVNTHRFHIELLLYFIKITLKIHLHTTSMFQICTTYKNPVTNKKYQELLLKFTLSKQLYTAVESID